MNIKCWCGNSQHLPLKIKFDVCCKKCGKVLVSDKEENK